MRDLPGALPCHRLESESGMKNDHTHPPTSHPYSVPSFLPATWPNFISKFHQNKIADIAVIFFHDFIEMKKFGCMDLHVAVRERQEAECE